MVDESDVGGDGDTEASWSVSLIPTASVASVSRCIIVASLVNTFDAGGITTGANPIKSGGIAMSIVPSVWHCCCKLGSGLHLPYSSSSIARLSCPYSRPVRCGQIPQESFEIMREHDRRPAAFPSHKMARFNR
jgi:hypothetical protein